MNHLKPEPGRPLAVFGTGCVGLSAVMAAAVAGCRPIIAVDRVPARLELAAVFGATHCAGVKDDVVKFIKGICGGVDYAFDTSGSPGLLGAMGKVLNPGASACGVGIGGTLELSERDRREAKSWAVTDAGFSVPRLFIPELLKYHIEGRFPFEKMLSYYRFGQINDAFEASRECTVVKPVVLTDLTDPQDSRDS